MKHEILVSFDIDDSTIQKHIEDDAYDDIVSNLTKHVVNQLDDRFKRHPHGYDDPMEDFVAGVVGRKVDGMREEIVDLAALMMAKRAATTKTWKQVLEESREELS